MNEKEKIQTAIHVLGVRQDGTHTLRFYMLFGFFSALIYSLYVPLYDSLPAIFFSGICFLCSTLPCTLFLSQTYSPFDFSSTFLLPFSLVSFSF